MMNYQEVVEYLYEQLPMYQRSGPAAYKNNLENTIRLDEMFGNPHQSFRSIHITGTNGKGSVSHMLASVLQEAGYKTGLYTSPHLKDFRERIRVNGEMISEQAVVDFTTRFLEKNKTEMLNSSFFELTVAMAFDYFRNQKIDIAVIEVGLGGRLDSTNIIFPEVSVITNISLDHTALLGETVEQIAKEKAGIIKQGVPVVIGEGSEAYNFVFRQVAEEMKSLLYFADREYEAAYSMVLPEGRQSLNVQFEGKLQYPNLQLDLLGNYQRRNVLTVLKSIDILRQKGWEISNDDIYLGLSKIVKNTGLLGRWQVLGHNPMIVCDTAHNRAGIEWVVDQIRQTAWKSLHMVIGMVSDKEPGQVLSLLPQEGHYYFTRANIPRATGSMELAQKAKPFGLKGECFDSVPEALQMAKKNANKNDLVFIGGSTFVVAEVL